MCFRRAVKPSSESRELPCRWLKGTGKLVGFMPLTQHGITRPPDTHAPPASKFTHGLETLSGEATISVHSLFLRVSTILSRKGSPGSSDRRFDELKTFTAPSNALRSSTSIVFAVASSLCM